MPDRLIDSEHQLAECREPRWIAEVDLELVVEGLLVAVLPRAARSRAGDHRADGLQCFDIYFGIVFTAIVAVEDSRSRMIVQSVHECREYELYRMRGVYRETDDLPGIEVDNGSDVYEPSLKRDIREVSTPDVVLVHRTDGHQEVRINNLDVVGLLPLPASSPVCLNAEDIHHSLHFLAIHLEMDGETP